MLRVQPNRTVESSPTGLERFPSPARPEGISRELLVGGQLEIVRVPSAAEAGHLWATSQAVCVAWLQPDDKLQLDQAERIVEAFHAQPDCSVVYGNARLVDGRGASLNYFHPRKPTRSALARRFCLLPAATFIRRTSLEQAGNLDGNWHYWAPFEHWLRLAQAGCQFSHLDFSLVDRVVTPGNPLLSQIELAELPLACAELINVLQSRLGRVSVSWAIWLGRAAAASQGLGRHTSRDYDRVVLAEALASLGKQSNSRLAEKLNLLVRHFGTEGLSILRNPAMAKRLWRNSNESPWGKWWREFRSPSLFRLQRHPPARALRIASESRAPAARGSTREQLPSIALVTPNFNCGQFLERTIQSVLQQNYPQITYHVQDGGSSDQSVPILERYRSQIDSWESIADRGQADAINRGFKQIQGEVMGWLNSDDLLLPGALQRIGRFFARHPQVDVVYGHRLLIDSADRVINRWVLPRHDGESIRWADYIPQETMFWRRDLWERCGSRIHDDFQFAMDWELILRFRRAGARFHRLPYFLGAFRITDTQKTSQLLASTGLQESNRLRRQELGYVPSNEEVQRRMKSYVRRHWWADKWLHLREQISLRKDS